MALKGLAVTDTHAVRLMLAVGDLPPSAAVLLDPVAPQSDFPRDPILRWKQPGPAVNHIDVAEEPGFDNVVFTSAIDQVGSEREIQLPSLAPNTTHNWRVRSDNGCAAEAVSATGQFTTGQGHSLGNPRIAMPIGIPDNDPVGVQLSLDFDVSIAALTVELEILHSYVGDLQVELQHVDTGTTVRLLDRPASIWPEFPLGCPRENIHVRLKDTAAPDKNSLANLQCESLPAIGREYLDFNAEPSAWRDDYDPVEPLSAFSSEPFWGTWKLIVRDLQASDIGTLVSWCLEYQQGLRFCSHPGGTIPDNDSNGTISTMRLPFALTDLDVGPLNIAHSWVGDLAIDLNPPTGPARRILDRPGVPATPFGCSADNIGALILDDDGPSIDAEDTCSLTGDALAGRLRPTDLLNVVDGLPISGTWTFTVRDVSVNDFGIVSELALMPSGIEFHSGEEIFSDGFESDQPP
jgi:subtilisin-like proprotein convertase family protein